ncbi:uncharacterized protein [Nicotiana sylvestris]|uniref:uncharacterized protein n=1 Tax=Nicotiana sylvestris TaxID=4096 RepID=UPI00388CAF39
MGDKEGKGHKGACRLRIGSWNIGTLASKFIELARILEKGKVNIASFQETRWVGSRARNVDEYKLWYSGVLNVGESTLNVVSAYAPQTGLDEELKRGFWERLDEIVCSIPPAERLFIEGDFNGHIGSTANDYGKFPKEGGAFGYFSEHDGKDSD